MQASAPLVTLCGIWLVPSSSAARSELFMRRQRLSNHAHLRQRCKALCHCDQAGRRYIQLRAKCGDDHAVLSGACVRQQNPSDPHAKAPQGVSDAATAHMHHRAPPFRRRRGFRTEAPLCKAAIARKAALCNEPSRLAADLEFCRTACKARPPDTKASRPGGSGADGVDSRGPTKRMCAGTGRGSSTPRSVPLSVRAVRWGEKGSGSSRQVVFVRALQNDAIPT